MSQQPQMSPDAFVVGYNPLPMANRVAQLSRAVQWSVASSLLGLALWTAVFWWKRDQLHGLSPWAIAAGFAISAVIIAVRVAALLAARRNLASVGSGTAMVLTRDGVQGDAGSGQVVQIPWSQVASVAARRRGRGRGPDLVVTRHDGTDWRVPLEFLDALPGTIDNALRVYSTGRHGLDASQLDSLI